MPQAGQGEWMGGWGLFLTVRHWWGSGRGKVTARLFLFELCVVIAGVLIAQALAGIAQDRADLTRMQSERLRIRYELVSVHNAFQVWQAALPCLNQTMTEVMKGVPPDQAHGLRRPRFPTPNLAAPSPDVLNLVGRYYGAEERDRLNWILESTRNSGPVIASIIADWGRLELLDPSNGGVTATDRHDARVAAADIKAELRGLEVLSIDTNQLLAKMNIGSRNLTEPGYGPARSCAAIWGSNRLDPPTAF